MDVVGRGGGLADPGNNCCGFYRRHSSCALKAKRFDMEAPLPLPCPVLLVRLPATAQIRPVVGRLAFCRAVGRSGGWVVGSESLHLELARKTLLLRLVPDNDSWQLTTLWALMVIS